MIRDGDWIRLIFKTFKIIRDVKRLSKYHAVSLGTALKIKKCGVGNS